MLRTFFRFFINMDELRLFLEQRFFKQMQTAGEVISRFYAKKKSYFVFHKHSQSQKLDAFIKKRVFIVKDYSFVLFFDFY